MFYPSYKINAPQNPKEKSKVDTKMKLMKSKKFIIRIEVKKFILEEVTMLKVILKHYLSQKTSKRIKNRLTKRVNDELTQYAITHNIKKIHKHTSVNVLKTILNSIKQEKTRSRNVDINIIDKL